MWFTSLLGTLVKRRRFIIANTISVTVVAVIICFLLPKTYRGKATILPPESQSPLSSLLGISPGQIAMAVTNFTLPLMATPSDLYASMLESNTILESVVDSLDLTKVYDVQTRLQAVANLKGQLSIKVEPDGIVSIEADASSAQLAADISNSLVFFLDNFNRRLQRQKSSDYNNFLTIRIKETDSALALAQNRLRSFQETNRAIALDLQSEALISNLAQQKAVLTTMEIELEMLRKTLYPGHPSVVQKELAIKEIKAKLREIEDGAKNQTDSALSALDIPLIQVPELSLKFAILKRDAKIQEAIYELLSQQAEMARIQERKDTPTLMVLDHARTPELPIKPKKR
ncbi:MAG: Wzz/FepE/Etk N-terminal domain-containing protein, partial [candidate division Zixibacteria bacterium]|nr:Wzz/FepE/Etk N-terminal domain-containing protein [candidate division Zixibacteria bacterium]